MIDADSDPSDEIPLANKLLAKKSEESPQAPEPIIPPQPTPGTPPATHTTGSSHKKGARSNHKKGKGKNQYTKDRDIDRDDSPARSLSRDVSKHPEDHSTGAHTKAHSGDHKSTSKGKHGVPHKMSMLDMKRRVGAIMDFISRTQVDLAAEGSIGSSSSSGDESPQKTPSAQLNGEAEKPAETNGQNGNISTDKEFKDLNCIEMMDVLTRDMVKWQNQYT